MEGEGVHHSHMEGETAHHPHIIEITGDVREVRSTRGNKVCGTINCGFADASSNSKDAKERVASMRKIWMAVVLCVIFMIVEVIGGIKANSLAILSDAAHMLSDVAGFGISLFSIWAAGWEATSRQSYGFYRIEILGTLLSIQLIWLLTGILVYEAIVRLLYNSGEVEGMLMFIIAAFGLVVNVVMMLFLGHDHGHGGHSHGHGHEHEHGHDHTHGPSITKHHHITHSKTKHDHDHEHHEEHHSEHHDDHEHHNTTHGGHEQAATSSDGAIKEALLQEKDCCSDEKQEASAKSHKKERNINIQGAYLHVLGDTIQSLGVMIGGAVIWWKPEWKIIDLICTLLFSVIVLWTTVRMLRSILEVLMESVPREIDARRLEEGLLEMEEVEAVHELHIWAITVGKILLACHVQITPEADADFLLDKIIGYIQKEHNISHVTIQIER